MQSAPVSKFVYLWVGGGGSHHVVHQHFEYNLECNEKK